MTSLHLTYSSIHPHEITITNPRAHSAPHLVLIATTAYGQAPVTADHLTAMSAKSLASRPHNVPYTETDPPNINIYRLRMTRGWSQGDLARAYRPRITPNAVSRIERNQNFTRATLKHINAALGVDYQSLFLPPTLAPYTTLPPDVQQRLANTIADITAAYTTKPHPHR